MAPVEADGYIWWEVELEDENTRGWVVEFADFLPTLMPLDTSSLIVYELEDDGCRLYEDDSIELRTPQGEGEIIFRSSEIEIEYP